MRYATLTDENMAEFMRNWVFDCRDQYDFVEKLGGARWVAKARRLTKTTEYDNEDEGYDYSYQPYTLNKDTDIYY